MPHSFWTQLLDVVAPRHCLSCGCRLLADERVVCHACWHHMPITGFEACLADNAMSRLFWGHVPVERAAALFFYEPLTLSARIIHAIKYFGRDDIAGQMGQILARHLTGSGFFADVDFIVPVPLTRGRQRQRGYNQSEKIARGISRATGITMVADGLRRIRFVESQTHLNPRQRRENVAHAFTLGRHQQLAHRHVLLVDDVVTTGSTLTACAEELLRVPGVRLSIVTLAMAKI